MQRATYLGISDADLRTQFEVASQIRDRVNEANNAILQIRRIKREIDDRLKKSQNADVKAIAEQLQKELTAVEEEIPRGVVVADSGYGNDGQFRCGVTELALEYVVGVQSSTTAWEPGTDPLPPRPRVPGRTVVRSPVGPRRTWRSAPPRPGRPPGPDRPA